MACAEYLPLVRVHCILVTLGGIEHGLTMREGFELFKDLNAAMCAATKDRRKIAFDDGLSTDAP